MTDDARTEDYGRVNEVVHTGGRWVPPKLVRIPDLHTGATYIARVVLFRTPWGGVYLHRINLPDGDRHPHNHARTFWSLILRGGYREQVIRPGRRFCRTWRAGSVHKAALSEYHSIERLFRVPTWSLLLVGPSRQDWGFLTPEGHVLADDYRGWLLAHSAEHRGES